MSDTRGNNSKIAGGVGLGAIFINMLAGLGNCGTRTIAKETVRRGVHYTDDIVRHGLRYSNVGARLGQQSDDAYGYFSNRAAYGDDIGKTLSESEERAFFQGASKRANYKEVVSRSNRPGFIGNTFEGRVLQEQKKTYEAIVKMDKSLEGQKEYILFRVLITPEHELVNLQQSFSRYVVLRKKIASAFGERSPMVLKFESDVFYLRHTPFDDCVKRATNNLVPKQLDLIPNNTADNEIYALLTGNKLNNNQAEVLSKITGRNFSASTNRFDDCILIQSNENGRFVVSTTSTIKEVKGFENTLSNLNARGKKIIFNGKIDENGAKYLNTKKVYCITEYSTFIRSTYRQVKEVEVIYIASTEEKELVGLFDISPYQAKLLAKKFNEIAGLPRTKIVSTKEMLRYELAMGRYKDRHVIVIFNNSEGTLFNESIANFNIENAITCNSYTISGNQFTWQTTNHVYISDAIKSLTEVTKLGQQSLDEFYSRFAINYNVLLANRTNSLNYATVGVASGTTATVSGVIYYNKRKK